MSAVRARENTFKVDLSDFPKRPSFEEIHGFIHETLGLTVDQVLRLQMNHAQNCAHVKCRDLKTAQDIVEQHNNRHEWDVNKVKIKVRLAMDDGGVEIKIHDLSENVRNEDIAAFLQHYGEVVSIKEQVWGENFAFKGVSSGVRVAKVILRRHIKSFVTISGEESLISYRNQPQWCRHCTNPSHPGSTCVENKKLLGQKVDLNNRLKAAQNKSSYANVLNQSSSVASLMPKFVGTNLNQLNDAARRVQAVDDGITPSTSRSIVPPPAKYDERMDENDGITVDAVVVAAAAVTAVDTAAATPATVDAAATVDVSTVIDLTSAAVVLPAASNGSEDRSTRQALPEAKNITECQVSLFKIPPNPTQPNSLSMEISESESNESSAEDGSFMKVKNRRGRSKKAKIDASLSISA